MLASGSNQSSSSFQASSGGNFEAQAMSLQGSDQVGTNGCADVVKAGVVVYYIAWGCVECVVFIHTVKFPACWDACEQSTSSSCVGTSVILVEDWRVQLQELSSVKLWRRSNFCKIHNYVRSIESVMLTRAVSLIQARERSPRA